MPVIGRLVLNNCYLESLLPSVGVTLLAMLFLIVPTLCVVTPQWTLCVRFWDAERPGRHSHAERGNDLTGICIRQ